MSKSHQVRIITRFWATACKRFALCYRTVVLSVCPVLSVTLLYCGQTVGWIKMKLGMQVGLVPGHIVLDGDSAPSSPNGLSPPIFGPSLLWPHGWMHQDATWYGGRSRRKRQCYMGTPPKKAHLPIFGQCLLWPNGCMYRDTTWYRSRPHPSRHCVRWGLSSPSLKGHSPLILGQCPS